jgi:DNA (cytosine-5)-methyltransferase 1
MTKKPLRVASLFAGCGGLDLGFRGGFQFRNRRFARNNFEIVFANDFDTDANTVYSSNKKYLGRHTPSFGDIRDINEKDVPEFDVLIAGFPCQPFSNAGDRESTLDTKGRGTLFYECERLLAYACKRQKVKPVAFIFENVRGIMSSKMPDGTSVVDEIARRMEPLGYKISTQLVNASEFGVPQNRYRFLIIGIRKDLDSFDFNSLYTVVKKNKLPSSRNNKYELTLGSLLCDIPISAPQRNVYWKYSPGGQKMIDQIGPVVCGKSMLPKFKRGTPLESMPPEITLGRSWKNIPPKMLSPRFRKIFDNPKKYHAPNFYRRFALGEICGTITASAQPENCGITHPFENRRMSIREIARIQSFPDDFTFDTKTLPGAYKVIGNAVPPILGWVIARALQDHLQRNGVI